MKPNYSIDCLEGISALPLIEVRKLWSLNIHTTSVLFPIKLGMIAAAKAFILRVHDRVAK